MENKKSKMSTNCEISNLLNKKLGTFYQDDNEIMWDTIIFHPKMTEDVLLDLMFYHEVNYLALLRTREFSESTLIEFSHNINDIMYVNRTNFVSMENLYWKTVSSYQPLTERFLELFVHQIDWEALSLHNTLSERLIDKYYYTPRDYSASPTMITNFIYRYPLSEDFYRAHKDCIDWSIIGKNQVLSEGFIDEFKHLINWKNIRREDYSKEFIEKEEYKYKLLPISELINLRKHNNNYPKYFDERLDFQALYEGKTIDKEFLVKIYDRVDWNDYVVTYRQKFGENIKETFLEVIDEFLNWNYIFQNLRVSENLLEKHVNDENIDWDIISVCQRLNHDFIQKYNDKLNWEMLSEFQELDEDIIDKNINRINWLQLSAKIKLSKETLKKYSENLIWPTISKRSDLTLDLIEEFPDDVCWVVISARHDLNEDFYRKYRDKIDWEMVSNLVSLKNLSIEFIEEFADYLDWSVLSHTFSEIPEEILEKFGNRIDWAAYQREGYNNIPEHIAEKNDINWSKLCEDQKLSEDFLKRNKNKVDWLEVYRNHYLSDEFAKKMKKYINASLNEADPDEKYYKRIK